MSIERKVVDWIESRFGLKADVLRPVPEYSVNPFYWLGALTVIAFVVQVVTGMLMLIYYVPTTEQAYSSTLYIMNSVPLGWLLETVHLYGAYAMILLALLHLFRGYFASVHKKPREMMWVIGMLMGFVVLGFGLTGYLLTWTVVSYSATDVSIGMLNLLPEQVGPTLKFLLAGVGGDAARLTRFFDLHIVVLPAALLGLLLVKMWMFESHGAAEPVTGTKPSKDVPIFPNIVLYIGMIGSAFVALLLMAAVLFPIHLAPEFSPLAASTNVAQPEWYFLWMYQILKFTAAEGATCIPYYCIENIKLALGAVSILAVVLILLPFIDRSRKRDPAARPLYITLGIILAAEIAVLTYWGYVTPGVGIPNSQAVVVLLGTALSIAAMAGFTYWARNKMRGVQAVSPAVGAMALPFTHRKMTALFLLPLAVGSVTFASMVGSLKSSPPSYAWASVDLLVLVVSFCAMVMILKLIVNLNPGVRR